VSVVRFSGVVDAVNLATTLPVDATRTVVRFAFFVPDDQGASTVGSAFVSEIERQIAEDRPIWEHNSVCPFWTHRLPFTTDRCPSCLVAVRTPHRSEGFFRFQPRARIPSQTRSLR
jgi:hypothetical protein